ncbi:hypothetical protein C1O61_02685 [Akkermansia muciniphila]|nr:hypothetical protein C1O61_02685 [Akkermansia muciniphila]
MTQALAQRGVRGALEGMATGRVGKLAGRGRAWETGWESCGGTGVARGCSHLNPRTIGSLWSSGKGRILQEGRINACLVATVRSFVHQAQTPHLKESRTKKAADRIIRGLFSLLTTYGTKNHPERILNCFFHPSDRSCEG